MAHLEFFSPARIALSQEIQFHPKLVEYLQNHQQAEFEVMLAEIALYCEVVLDGLYTAEDIDILCDLLYKRLRAKRSEIILLH